MAAKKKTDEVAPATQADSGASVDLTYLTVTVGMPGTPSAEFYAVALGIALGSITLEQGTHRLMDQFRDLDQDKQREWVRQMDQAVARLQSVVRELPSRVIVR